MDFFITKELIDACKLVTEGRGPAKKDPKTGKPVKKAVKPVKKEVKSAKQEATGGRGSDVITAYFKKKLNVDKFKKLLGDAYFKYHDASISGVGKAKGEYSTKGSKAYASDIKKLAGKDAKTAKAIIDAIVDIQEIEAEGDDDSFMEEDDKKATYKISLKTVSNKSFNQAFKDSFDYTWSTAPLYDMIRGQTTAASIKPDDVTKILLDANKKIISEFGLIDTEVPVKKTR